MMKGLNLAQTHIMNPLRFIKYILRIFSLGNPCCVEGSIVLYNEKEIATHGSVQKFAVGSSKVMAYTDKNQVNLQRTPLLF